MSGTDDDQTRLEGTDDGLTAITVSPARLADSCRRRLGSWRRRTANTTHDGEVPFLASRNSISPFGLSLVLFLSLSSRQCFLGQAVAKVIPVNARRHRIFKGRFVLPNTRDSNIWTAICRMKLYNEAQDGSLLVSEYIQ